MSGREGAQGDRRDSRTAPAQGLRYPRFGAGIARNRDAVSNPTFIWRPGDPRERYAAAIGWPGCLTPLPLNLVLSLWTTVWCRQVMVTTLTAAPSGLRARPRPCSGRDLHSGPG